MSYVAMMKRERKSGMMGLVQGWLVWFFDDGASRRKVKWHGNVVHEEDVKEEEVREQEEGWQSAAWKEL